MFPPGFMEVKRFNSKAVAAIAAMNKPHTIYQPANKALPAGYDWLMLSDNLHACSILVPDSWNAENPFLEVE
jgi:hypothetical protein